VNPKVYFIDIDETICEYKGPRNYEDAVPIHGNIAKVNKYYNMGHVIVMWTARGATTGIDYTDLTMKQLEAWDVKYHELRLDKPFYDHIIDDKALRIEEV
jgi:histidinol phosphatase-like enzyme